MRLYALLAFLALWASSCATAPTQTRLSSVEPIVVTWRVWGPQGAEPVPSGLRDAVNTDLRSYGFEPVSQGDTEFALVVELRAAQPVRMDRQYRWSLAMRSTFSQAGQTPRFIENSYSTLVSRPSASALLAIESAADRLRKDIALGTQSFVSSIEPRTPVPRQPPTSTGLYRAGDAMYFIMVDRFANGDPSNDGEIDPKDPQAFHGGDLQGIIDHLDELKALGIKSVWISPVFKMRTEPFFGHGAFHGYWLEDPHVIEPRFGTEATLKALNDELAKRDMRLVMDVVLNHVAPESEMVTQHPDWFHLQGPIKDWDNPDELQTHDVHGLPDLDQDVPQAYQWVAGGTLAWIDKVHPAGFRLDAVKHISEAFWQRFNRDAMSRGGPDFLLLGEHLDGNPASVANVARMAGFNAMFDFPLHFAIVDVFCRDQSPARLAAILSADRLYGDALGADRRGLMTLLDNHDLPRILSACGGDVGRVRQAMQFMLSARGTPSFTWGTEAGLLGGGEPHNRADMVFGSDHPMERIIRDGLERRRLRPVLQTGQDVILTVDDNVFAYIRAGSPQDEVPQVALVVVNTSIGLRTITLPSELSPSIAQVEVPAGQTSVTLVDVSHEALAKYRQQHQKPSLVSVEFIVDNLELEPGETVALVGSGPELGNWDPAQAPTFSPRNTQLTLDAWLPSDLVFAYKLVRLKDGAAVWEARADRYVFVKPGQSIQLSFGR